VPSTLFDAVIFDFDGTLVDSAVAKRQAFFKIFPVAAASLVEEVLLADPDGSRYRVIPRMVESMIAHRIALDHADPSELIGRFAEVSEQCVAEAKELPAASELLRRLSATMKLHLCSNTPEETVRRHVVARGWSAYFTSVDGYPTTKQAKIADIMAAGRLPPHRVAMVGDGISDEEAAAANGCAFFPIRARDDLVRIAAILEGTGV
jgi:phosphoglycolate phosphatase-like HAD superfamily hydrolase